MLNNMRHWYLFSLLASSVFAYLPSPQETSLNRSRLLQQKIGQADCTAIPEGKFVYFFHPKVLPWLQEPLNANRVQVIQESLRPHLRIPLTREGFTMASIRKREGELDTTNYSAVWVRDACWHYYGLKIDYPADAKRIMQNLLRFYVAQRKRFINVIMHPEIASNPMALPLIRFSKETLDHHQVRGEDQVWNHNQFDSHGLFMLALSDAVSTNILPINELTENDYISLALFPVFLTVMDYAKRKDVGPWEEVPLYNASSAGLVAAGIKRMMDVIGHQMAFAKAVQTLGKEYSSLRNTINQAVSQSNINTLYESGMRRVEYNLSLGGEAPSIDGYNRQADIALLFLCLVKHTPYYNNPDRIKQILNITKSLVGPYGVNRYHDDAYQARNYWIASQLPSKILGPNTKEKQFITRFQRGYMPNQQPLDAQWFFDANFASVYYQLAQIDKDPFARRYFLQEGDIHLKRSLGQLTGPDTISAGGEKLSEWQLAESINFVDIHGQITPLPSPICPLSWATAALQMALRDATAAHQATNVSQELVQVPGRG